jgi:DtxR family transcriptional regulator, manganese transport regulator
MAVTIDPRKCSLGCNPFLNLHISPTLDRYDYWKEGDIMPEPVPDMPDPSAQSERFTQARAAQAVAVLEDYAEMIGDLTQEMGEARITDIAARMGVTHPTATKAVARLKREGLVTSRPYRGVFLTDAGARHRTVVDLLMAIGVPEETAELDAEGMEHHVSAITLAAFEAYLAQRPSAL